MKQLVFLCHVNYNPPLNLSSPGSVGGEAGDDCPSGRKWEWGCMLCANIWSSSYHSVCLVGFNTHARRINIKSQLRASGFSFLPLRHCAKSLLGSIHLCAWHLAAEQVVFQNKVNLQCFQGCSILSLPGHNLKHLCFHTHIWLNPLMYMAKRLGSWNYREFFLIL